MGRVWRCFPYAFVLLLAADAAHTDDAAPTTLSARVDAVLTAVQSEDAVALAALATSDSPDPWLVAEELCLRGEAEAARDFARAAPRQGTETLPAYVASRSATTPDDEATQALVATLDASEPKALEDCLADHPATVALASSLRARAQTLHLADTHTVFATRLYLCAGSMAERVGWLAMAFEGYVRAGVLAEATGMPERGAAAFNAARALAEHHGSGGSVLLDSTVRVQFADAQARQRHKEGLAAANELVLLRREGRPDELGWALEARAYQLEALGRFRDSQAVYEEAISAYTTAERDDLAAVAYYRLAGVLECLGQTERALELASRALSAARELGLELDTVNEFRMWVANFEYRLGRLDTARTSLEALLAEARERGDERRIVLCLGNLANVVSKQDQVGTALSFLEEAEELVTKLGDEAMLLDVLGNMADMLKRVGETKRALALYEQTLALHQKRGEEAEVAATYIDLGFLYRDISDVDRALASFLEGMRRAEAIEHAHWLANALTGIGELYLYLRDDPTKALLYFEREREIREQMGDELGTLDSQLRLARAYADLGDPRGPAVIEKALVRARELGENGVITRALGHMAVIAFREDRHRDVIALTRELLVRGARRTKDLDDVSAARVGDPWQEMSSVGILSALKLEDSVEVAWFMEAGRSQQLVRVLGGRAAVLEVALDPELAAAERAARADEARALAVYRRVSGRGNLKAIRAALGRVKEARQTAERLAARISREMRRSAPYVDPKPLDLERIQASLRPDDIFLAIKSFDTFAVFLRITHDEIDSGRLYQWEQIQALAQKTVDTGGREYPALTMLKLRLTMDCRVGSHFKRILFSPDGVLAYMPPAVVFPGRNVTLVPSATVHALLLDQDDERGEGVLAVGDVDYAGSAGRHAGGGRLLPLPATRAEALAVGTETMLGAAATETALVRRLGAPKRLRALHLACHGILDAEEGTRSALMLGPDASNDGALTTLDIFRLKVDADLVVLSACETARGKVYASEGVMGLTRAFMDAGAPRVLCSLWKVDDDATAALMVKFYELWNPESGVGMGAAEALAEAQRHVRSIEVEVEGASKPDGTAVTKRKRPWSHPYYWAAWVLWGLPD